MLLVFDRDAPIKHQSKSLFHKSGLMKHEKNTFFFWAFLINQRIEYKPLLSKRDFETSSRDLGQMLIITKLHKN